VKPEERLADALKGVEGAYCLTVIVGNTLLAARDPRGWRPLVMGKLGDATVFASESCALDLLGATLEREVERGEIIAIDESGMRSIFPLEKKDSRSASSSTSTFRALTARCSAVPWTEHAESLGDVWRATSPPRRLISSSASPIHPTRQRLDSLRNRDYRSSWH